MPGKESLRLLPGLLLPEVKRQSWGQECLSALLLPTYKAIGDLGELDQREGNVAYFLAPQGKLEDPLGSPDACRAAEQKPPPQGHSKASAPPLPQRDSKRPAEPLCTSQFGQGLPTDLEEQRTFLTERCITAFHLCLSRFPQHYKSLYRLACLYACSPTHKVVGGQGSANVRGGDKARTINLSQKEKTGQDPWTYTRTLEGSTCRRNLGNRVGFSSKTRWGVLRSQ